MLNPRPMIPESTPPSKPDVVAETATATKNKCGSDSTRDRRTELLLSDCEATKADSVLGNSPLNGS